MNTRHPHARALLVVLLGTALVNLSACAGSGSSTGKLASASKNSTTPGGSAGGGSTGGDVASGGGHGGGGHGGGGHGSGSHGGGGDLASNALSTTGGLASKVGGTVGLFGTKVGQTDLPLLSKESEQAAGGTVTHLGAALTTLGNGLSTGLGQSPQNGKPLTTTVDSVGDTMNQTGQAVYGVGKLIAGIGLDGLHGAYKPTEPCKSDKSGKPCESQHGKGHDPLGKVTGVIGNAVVQAGKVVSATDPQLDKLGKEPLVAQVLQSGDKTILPLNALLGKLTLPDGKHDPKSPLKLLSLLQHGGHHGYGGGLPLGQLLAGGGHRLLGGGLTGNPGLAAPVTGLLGAESGATGVLASVTTVLGGSGDSPLGGTVASVGGTLGTLTGGTGLLGAESTSPASSGDAGSNSTSGGGAGSTGLLGSVLNTASGLLGGK